MTVIRSLLRTPIAAVAMAFLAGCAPHAGPSRGPPARAGDEIVVCGQRFHAGTPVVLWTDPGGFDAYRAERIYARPAGAPSAVPPTYDDRGKALAPGDAARARAGGWDLALLRDTVDQFVIHYDNSGTSRGCFTTLHDVRGLSVHFMIDLDGTVYQTLDLRERAWHATKANARSVGVEVASVGAYPASDGGRTLAATYRHDPDGRTRVVLPPWASPAWIRTPGFVARPSRNEPVTGMIQGEQLQMYDLTPEQYHALTRLTAALCTVFPKITCDYPRDEHGRLARNALTEDQFARYHGLLGHYHVQPNKTDPGPAFQWDLVVQGARKQMRGIE